MRAHAYYLAVVKYDYPIGAHYGSYALRDDYERRVRHALAQRLAQLRVRLEVKRGK